jgi:hypothetical protein
VFNKLTTFRILKDGIEVLDNDLVKTASEMILPPGHKYDPDFLYMKVRAVSAGEFWGPNKNSDFFPEVELLGNYKTFLNAHTFKNHDNKDIANAIGDVISAIWNEKMKFVELLLRIDRKIAPTVVRGFEKGFMTDVSMGCKIKHSVCSICGNIAKTKAEYCDHIKYERGKIYPDGRRVYEINIGPKFHDISAVLNGADRAAKVLGLYIFGDKVAFYGFEEGKDLEKVASLADSLYTPEENNFVPFYKTAGFCDLSKPSTVIDDVGDIFESESLKKCANDKQRYIQKIAEIKKIIQGKVLAMSGAEAIKKAVDNNIDDTVKLLKLFYTNYWNQDKCKQIAEAIKAIAQKRGMNPDVAFEHFCHTAELAGIEMTSLEFDRIIRYLNGDDGDGTEEAVSSLSNMIPLSDASGTLDAADAAVNEFGDDVNMPTAIKVIRISRSVGPQVPDKHVPLGAIIRIIAKNTTPVGVEDSSFIDNDMMNILKPEMADRSFHQAHLVPRMVRIIKDDVRPNFDNIMHFILPLLLKTSQVGNIPFAASPYGYAAYQNNRVKFAMSDEYQAGLDKFASVIYGEDTLESSMAELGSIEKIAYNRAQAVYYGLPLTYGYSAMQRSRMRNGDQVSGFNRYVAENPQNAFLAQWMIAPAISKKISKATKTTGTVTKNLVKKVPILDNSIQKAKTAWKYLKKAEEENDYMFIMSKEASCLNDFSEMPFNIDMFNDKIIDEKLAAEYGDTKPTIIKYATVLYGIGEEDVCEDMLSKAGLSINDVNKYLKIAQDLFTMEIEKTADNMLKDVGLSVAQDMVFNPAGVSALALAPGNILDGFVLSKLTNKLNKDSQQNTQNATVNQNNQDNN